MSKKNILVDVWLVSLLGERLVEDLLAGTPLSTDEFALYGLIVDFEPVTVTQLSRWTGMPPTTLSTLVRRCEARGELTKVANPKDRRSSHLMLSEHGMALYRRCLVPFVDALAALRAAMPTPEAGLRLALADLDHALRTVLEVEPRPYEIDAEPTGQQLGYDGPPLTAGQRAEALGFLDWIRHRDAEP